MRINLLNQWNRIEVPERNSHGYGQLNFDKDARTFKGERMVFSKTHVDITGYAHARKIKMDSILHYKQRLT